MAKRMVEVLGVCWPYKFVIFQESTFVTSVVYNAIAVSNVALLITAVLELNW